MLTLTETPSLKRLPGEGKEERIPPGSFVLLLGVFFFFYCSFNKQLNSASVLNTLPTIVSLFHITLWGGDHHEPYFTDEKEDSLSNFPEDTG